jgi:hypothetical protein
MAVKAKTEMQKLDERVLRTLAELGETRVTEDAITIQGTKLVLPETMTPRDGIAFLRQYIEQQEEETAFTRVFNYRPWDVSAALQRALMKVTGSSGIAQATWSFFGKEPPELHTIQVGVNETLQVPAGLINVPMLNGQIQIGSHQHREYGPIGFVHVTAPRRFKAHIEGLFRVVEDELKAHSIYRTKAFDGQVEPEFLDLSGIDPRQVIYSDDTLQQLQANIWSVVENTSTLREMNIPRKRAVLLEGPYGTGKTLAAYLTAQKAVANGWTFIYARPGRDDLSTVMGTARLYQPSVVFFEDVDTISSGDETHDQVTKLLDLSDAPGHGGLRAGRRGPQAAAAADGRCQGGQGPRVGRRRSPAGGARRGGRSGPGPPRRRPGVRQRGRERPQQQLIQAWGREFLSPLAAPESCSPAGRFPLGAYAPGGFRLSW